jgi:hypothetical protein
MASRSKITLSEHDSHCRQVLQWEEEHPDVKNANLKMLCQSLGAINCCSELHALVAILPCISGNMLKSFVLVGPEQKAINSMIVMWINSASSKKTPIMRFLKRCWQNSPQTISLADGDANTGGFLQDMVHSMVSGTILGLYQEEEIFSECMGLDSEGNGGNAGLLNNICDGSSVSQKRKDGSRNLLLSLPRLNFLGNGHPFAWHVRQELACAVTKTKGQWQRQLHYTSKPVMSKKDDQGYSAMLHSTSNKSTFTVVALVFRLVTESHLVGTVAACKAAVTKFKGVNSARGDQANQPDELHSLPDYAQSKARSSAGDNAESEDTSECAYWWPRVEIQYKMHEDAWVYYKKIHAHYEHEWFDQLLMNTGTSSAALEGKTTNKVAQVALAMEALTFWLDVVVAHFATHANMQAVGNALPPVPADYNEGDCAKLLLDQVLATRPDFSREIGLEAVELSHKLVDLSNRIMMHGAGFDKAAAQQEAAKRNARDTQVFFMDQTTLPAKIAATPGRLVIGFTYSHTNEWCSKRMSGAITGSRSMGTTQSPLYQAMQELEDSGLGELVVNAIDDERFIDYFSGANWLERGNLRSAQYKLGFVKKGVPTDLNDKLEFTKKLKDDFGVGIITYEDALHEELPKMVWQPSSDAKAGTPLSSRKRRRDGDTPSRNGSGSTSTSPAGSASSASTSTSPTGSAAGTAPTSTAPAGSAAGSASTSTSPTGSAAGPASTEQEEEQGQQQQEESLQTEVKQEPMALPLRGCAAGADSTTAIDLDGSSSDTGSTESEDRN